MAARQRKLVVPPDWEYLRPWLEDIERFQSSVTSDLHDYFELMDPGMRMKLLSLAATIDAKGHWVELEEFAEQAPTGYHDKNLRWYLGQLLILLDWARSGDDESLNHGD